jgi:hypothetical protein
MTSIKENITSICKKINKILTDSPCYVTFQYFTSTSEQSDNYDILPSSPVSNLDDANILNSVDTNTIGSNTVGINIPQQNTEQNTEQNTHQNIYKNISYKTNTTNSTNMTNSISSTYYHDCNYPNDYNQNVQKYDHDIEQDDNLIESINDIPTNIIYGNLFNVTDRTIQNTDNTLQKPLLHC